MKRTWMLECLVLAVLVAAGCGEGSGPNSSGDKDDVMGTGGTGVSGSGGTGVSGSGGTGAPGGGGVGGTGVSGSGGAGGTVGGAGTGGTGVSGSGGAGGTAGGAGTGGAGGSSGGAGGGGAGGGGAGGGGAGAGGTGGNVDPQVQQCLDGSDSPENECTQCGCEQCTEEVLNCRDEDCAAIVACGRDAGCSGRECYCGEGVDALGCATGGAVGECRDLLAEASGLVQDDCSGVSGLCCEDTVSCATAVRDISDPENANYDPENPVTRARAVSQCTQGQEEITDPISPQEHIEGNCEDVCK